jgi:hypothetical protein
MKIARLSGGIVALCALAAVALLYAGTPAHSFELQDSPATVARPGADITDAYLFPSPTNTKDVVAVMDVYPLIAAGQGLNTFFDQTVLYTMKFDNKYQGEAVGSRPIEDYVLQFSFGTPGGGTQQVFVYGPSAPVQTGTNTILLNGGAETGLGFINKVFQTSTGVTVFAGARQDPFFFDLQQFYKILPDRMEGSTSPSCLPSTGSGACPGGFNNPGTDFFANANVLSIVVELPKSLLLPSGSGPIVAYWATTSSATGK